MKLLIQEQHVPGRSLTEKVPTAHEWGFDGFELRGKGDFHFARRMDEFRAAKAAGGYFPTVCPEMPHFIGNFDAKLRADAVTQLCSMLDVVAELGGKGVMTPASWGMFSKRLPPFTPPRNSQGDHDALYEGFSKVAEHAQAKGVEIYLEPLNRYEDHMINKLGDAAALVKEIGNPAFKVVCDTYHMNIEEEDPVKALEEILPQLGHVQLSDSNRLEPGAGHVDFKSIIDLLASNGYEGDLAFEHQLSGDPAEVLPRSAAYIRSLVP